MKINTSIKDTIVMVFITMLLLIGVNEVRRVSGLKKYDELVAEAVDTLPPAPVYNQHGIVADSFVMQEGRIRNNQMLATLLASFNLDGNTIYRITNKVSNVLDVKKIKAGNHYFAYLSNDTLQDLHYFVYEHTPLDYLLVDLQDSIIASMHKKKVDTLTFFAAGSIETSLWNTMKDNKINPLLAIDLSEIYAWNIDFFGLQQKDSFRVFYDEYFVDTISIGTGKIHSAVFYHANEEFFAIPFIQDSVESYFDDEGNSLRRAFLKAPLRFSRISSGYSHSRFHPILKIHRPHHGVDYAAPYGTPIHAIGDGKIIKMGYHGGAGKMIKIRHNSVYTTAYLHLSTYGKGMSTGKYVKQGEVIGYVGSTGLSTGPHLDFRFYKNGYAINPLKVEAPPVEPVHEENLALYDSVKTDAINRLHQGYKP
ncbi:MAG: M23 family metallopeptidase [Bacteroidota bacterium]